MRLAIVSDIHGNLEAFEAVLKDITDQKADRTICLGDSIGYGPDPEAVVQLLRSRGIESVMGNHELGIRDARISEWFNPHARTSLEWTVTKLSDDSLSFLKTLPKAIVLEKMRFVHGFPPDSPLVYLFQIPDSSLSKVLERMDEQVCFIGHTHVLRLVIQGPLGLNKRRLTSETVDIQPECKAIVNVGSVGQPRDGDRRAKYVLFDTQARSLEVRFIEYPRETTIRKILAAGLPREHAERLT